MPINKQIPQQNTYGEINNSIILIKKIGSGGTSKVYTGYIKENPTNLFAVKVIKQNNQLENKIFSNEIIHLQKVNHSNVVKLFSGGEGILKKNSNGKREIVYFLVLEYVKYGELFDFIFLPKLGFGEEVGKYIFIQVLNGLEACHNEGIVHRDLKTENLMVDCDWKVKIGDFGFATKSQGKDKNGILYTSLGTASYASPEIHQKKPYIGVQSDIFSLGVTVFVIVTGKMPFKQAVIDDIYYKEIVKLNYEGYWSKLSLKIQELSDDFKQLFNMLVSYDPCIRPTIDEIKRHPWILTFDNTTSKERIQKEFEERLKIVQKKKEKEIEMKEKEKIKEKVKEKRFNIYKNQGSDEEKTMTNVSNVSSIIIEMNPYCIIYKNEYDPYSVFDYVYFRLLSIKGVEVYKDKQNELIVLIEYSPYENKEENEVIDYIKMSCEIKIYDETSIITEFQRVIGSKYDFYMLYDMIEKELLM